MTDKVSLKERLAPGFLYGAAIGAITGIALSLSYLNLYPIIAIIYTNATSREPFQPVLLLHGIQFIALVLFLFYLVGFSIGIPSSISIGLFTGFILGGVIATFFDYLSRGTSVLLGLLFGSAVAFIFFRNFGSWMNYWVAIGFPSIVYIISCGWIGMRICNRMALKLTQPIK